MTDVLRENGERSWSKAAMVNWFAQERFAPACPPPYLSIMEATPAKNSLILDFLDFLVEQLQ